MHLCVASIAKLDGVNDSAWERLEERSAALMLFGEADDRDRATWSHVRRCAFRDLRAVSPRELQHYFLR